MQPAQRDLPPPGVPTQDGLEAQAAYQPADKIGGCAQHRKILGRKAPNGAICCIAHEAAAFCQRAAMASRNEGGTSENLVPRLLRKSWKGAGLFNALYCVRRAPLKRLDSCHEMIFPPPYGADF